MSFLHRLHKKINFCAKCVSFFFRFLSVREWLYVTVLFNKIGCVFETVLGR